MKEIELDSDRYYRLRNGIVTDSDKDCDHADAIAKWEAESLGVCGEKTLAIKMSSQRKQDGVGEYLVKVGFFEPKKQEPPSNGCGTIFVNHWFENVPGIYPDGVQYRNCVFLNDVRMEGSRDTVFEGCFFLGSVNIERCRNIRGLHLRHCIIKGDLRISDCETEDLSIRDCDIFQNIVITYCIVRKQVSILNLHVRSSLHMTDNGFYGHGFVIKEAGIGCGLEINGCDFGVRTDISLCKAEEIKVKDTQFEDLAMDRISTHTYLDYECLVQRFLN